MLFQAHRRSTDADRAHGFRRPGLKRHSPTTVRKNTGDDYHGCLRIEVLRSTGLYRKIEGWASAAMAAGNRAPADLGHASN
jgi:hypothetical protein